MQAALDSFFCEETRAEHQRGVGSVGATGDGSDDDGAAGEVKGVAIVADGDVLAGIAFDNSCEGGFRATKGDAVLRALWTGECRFDGAEVEFELIAERGLGSGVGTEEGLFFAVCFDEGDLLVRPRGELQIGEGLRVDGEEAHRRAVLGGHIGNGGAVGNAEAGKPVTVEFDKFADDTFFAQHLGNGENEIRRRGASGQAAVETETDDFRDQHGRRLAEHGSFGLDAADAPAKDAEGVDHRSVRIRAHNGIGIGLDFVAGRHRANDAREIFEIHLMADAGVRGDDLEILESGLPPAEKSVALDVALEFKLGVKTESVAAAEIVHLDGVIDHQLGGEKWIDALGISAHVRDGFTHSSEVNDGGNPGKILQQNSRGHKGDFFLRCAGLPGGEGANVIGANEMAVLVAEEILEENTEREGELCQATEVLFFEGFKAMNFKGLGADTEMVTSAERIRCGQWHSRRPFEGFNNLL